MGEMLGFGGRFVFLESSHQSTKKIVGLVFQHERRIDKQNDTSPSVLLAQSSSGNGGIVNTCIEVHRDFIVGISPMFHPRLL